MDIHDESGFPVGFVEPHPVECERVVKGSAQPKAVTSATGDDDLENTVVLIAEKFSTLRLTTALEDCASAIEPYVKAYAAARLAECGVTLDKDGKPLTSDVCHTLNKRLERDLASAEKVIKGLLLHLEKNFHDTESCWVHSAKTYMEGK